MSVPQAFERGGGVTVFDKLEMDYKGIDGETSIPPSICQVVECQESIPVTVSGGRATAVNA